MVKPVVKEIELRIVGIDKSAITRRLRSIGAKHVAFRRFKRLEVRLVNTPEFKRWLRLRSDGKSAIFTMKENHGRKENVHEYSVGVKDFDAMGMIMIRSFSKNLKAYLESERDEWKLDGTEITIDKWPRIPHFMEIEGRSKAQVRKVYKKIGSPGKPIGNIWDVYRLYGLSFAKVARASNSTILKKLRT